MILERTHNASASSLSQRSPAASGAIIRSSEPSTTLRLRMHLSSFSPSSRGGIDHSQRGKVLPPSLIYRGCVEPPLLLRASDESAKSAYRADRMGLLVRSLADGARSYIRWSDFCRVTGARRALHATRRCTAARPRPCVPVLQRFGPRPAPRLPRIHEERKSENERKTEEKRREKEKLNRSNQLPLFCPYLEEADATVGDGTDASPVSRGVTGDGRYTCRGVHADGQGRWRTVALTGLWTRYVVNNRYVAPVPQFVRAREEEREEHWVSPFLSHLSLSPFRSPFFSLSFFPLGSRDPKIMPKTTWSNGPRDPHLSIFPPRFPCPFGASLPAGFGRIENRSRLAAGHSRMLRVSRDGLVGYYRARCRSRGSRGCMEEAELLSSWTGSKFPMSDADCWINFSDLILRRVTATSYD